MNKSTLTDELFKLLSESMSGFTFIREQMEVLKYNYNSDTKSCVYTVLTFEPNGTYGLREIAFSELGNMVNLAIAYGLNTKDEVYKLIQ